jgi:type II secretory pathway component PulM
MKILFDLGRQFWVARQARERVMLTWSALIVLAAIGWLLGAEPALDGRARLHAQLPLLRQQSAQMTQLTDEWAANPQRAGSAKAQFSPSLLADSLRAKGITPQRLEASEERVKLYLTDIAWALWIEWFTSLTASTDVVVLEANIKPGHSPGQVEIELALGAGK